MEAAPSHKFKTVEEYFAAFPEKTQQLMEGLRATIKKAAPQAIEKISYNMPAFMLEGMLVYYAAYDKHIGFYPTPSGIEAFKKELAGYKGAKGSVQFPIDKPLPLDLIAQIVKFRVEENLDKAREKKKK
ncbi:MULTISPECIES: iron chaperone [unclassified Imperialibacter]|uniref:iron chaperone n=1 Tax=unclassified Imperialibacter TaxID=2629706 RepID=UPI0012543F60|nr:MULTISPECIES: DUF1801 domain-containing protein [unclassified Imperialibacter]CAD5253219.1 conserved hypothetical protein [Imperialibacter sp. 75]CAD5285162.1 conserved hypothetical protein [Imperialibacter sp. 89]VVT23078.1 conserved hypothetical protein [Imperialibacter sp. EC-SDR9]